MQDIQTKVDLHRFIDAFYDKVLADKRLAPIFLDVAEIDLPEHIGHIRAYWEKLVFRDSDYNRHTMHIHRELHGKQALTTQDFEQWLGLFLSTMDEMYAGANADKAKNVATNIANNMVQHMLLDGEAHGGIIPSA